MLCYAFIKLTYLSYNIKFCNLTSVIYSKCEIKMVDSSEMSDDTNADTILPVDAVTWHKQPMNGQRCF